MAFLVWTKASSDWSDEKWWICEWTIDACSSVGNNARSHSSWFNLQQDICKHKSMQFCIVLFIHNFMQFHQTFFYLHFIEDLKLKITTDLYLVKSWQQKFYNKKVLPMDHRICTCWDSIWLAPSNFFNVPQIESFGENLVKSQRCKMNKVH